MHKSTAPFHFTIIDKVGLWKLQFLTVKSVLSNRLHDILSHFQQNYSVSKHLIGHFMYKI